MLYQQATPFLAQDNNYTSVGAIKVGGRPPEGAGFSGFFLPTAEPTYANGPVSIFPDARNPELALSIWEGDLFPGGRPQSVYTLDTKELTQLTKDDGTPLLIRLQPGQTFQLPGGRGSITFDRVQRFAGLSARVDPGKELTLVAAVTTILGLVARCSSGVGGSSCGCCRRAARRRAPRVRRVRGTASHRVPWCTSADWPRRPTPDSAPCSPSCATS